MSDTTGTTELGDFQGSTMSREEVLGRVKGWENVRLRVLGGNNTSPSREYHENTRNCGIGANNVA